MTIRFSESDYAEYQARHKGRSLRPTARSTRDSAVKDVEAGRVEKKAAKRGMNQWEESYERDILAIRKFAGEITWYKFEGIRLKLADGAWFKPDFAVMLANGCLEFHEVKGHPREAAMLRLKLAVEMYPFKFYLCKKIAGKWKIERLGK